MKLRNNAEIHEIYLFHDACLALGEGGVATELVVDEFHLDLDPSTSKCRGGVKEAIKKGALGQLGGDPTFPWSSCHYVGWGGRWTCHGPRRGGTTCKVDIT